MNKKAFSLIEIIVVVMILGVLSMLAFPRFLKTMEFQKVEVAKQQIDQIRAAVEVVAMNNKTYEFCGISAAAACDTTNDINDYVELDIHNADFNFQLELDAAPPVWIITAERQNGSKKYALSYQFYDEVHCSGADWTEPQCDDASVGYDSGACAWINM